MNTLFKEACSEMCGGYEREGWNLATLWGRGEPLPKIELEVEKQRLTERRPLKVVACGIDSWCFH